MEPDKEMLQFLISSHQPLLCCCINCNRGAAFPNISAVSKRTSRQPGSVVTDQLDQFLSKTCGSELATKFLAVKYS